MPYLVAVVDRTCVRPAAVSFTDLVTVAQKKFTNLFVGGGSATASFGLGNGFLGTRTPQT